MRSEFSYQFGSHRRHFVKFVFAHISRASSRLSLCACAVTSSINLEATDAISWNSCYVYVYSCALNMFKTIEGAADCEIRSVIRFLNARNVLPSEIHHQICQVYGDNVMSDGMGRKFTWGENVLGVFFLVGGAGLSPRPVSMLRRNESFLPHVGNKPITLVLSRPGSIRHTDWVIATRTVLCVGISEVNPPNTKRRPLYLKLQSVPRCKHFSSRL